MPSESRNAGSLSVHRSFVVQLTADADVRNGRIVGRVEHVVSGAATEFRTIEMLIAFLADVLEKPPAAGKGGASR